MTGGLLSHGEVRGTRLEEGGVTQPVIGWRSWGRHVIRRLWDYLDIPLQN